MNPDVKRKLSVLLQDNVVSVTHVCPSPNESSVRFYQIQAVDAKEKPFNLDEQIDRILKEIVRANRLNENNCWTTTLRHVGDLLVTYTKGAVAYLLSQPGPDEPLPNPEEEQARIQALDLKDLSDQMLETSEAYLMMTQAAIAGYVLGHLNHINGTDIRRSEIPDITEEVIIAWRHLQQANHMAHRMVLVTHISAYEAYGAVYAADMVEDDELELIGMNLDQIQEVHEAAERIRPVLKNYQELLNQPDPHRARA